MVQESSVLHHKHIRKRIHQKHEPFPHPVAWKRWLDKGIYVVGIAIPIMTIPQVLKIWLEQSAAGISILTWSVYFLGSIFWLVYGIAHKEKPIIVMHTLLIILNGLIVAGALLYS